MSFVHGGILHKNWEEEMTFEKSVLREPSAQLKSLMSALKAPKTVTMIPPSLDPMLGSTLHSANGCEYRKLRRPGTKKPSEPVVTKKGTLAGLFRGGSGQESISELIHRAAVFFSPTWH
uniref:Uncharacterized protein n=1 Tax=Hanusia phi TaxID=3032 RepID=A0A7S0EMX1_9CRYP|mmetsp:Transcript_28044/g.63404  ORF Transcript_28044/g.63404 Transcript_28044/m.63404 type:complete len:119 (+) Transcript_28044:356-712(+)